MLLPGLTGLTEQPDACAVGSAAQCIQFDKLGEIAPTDTKAAA
jgi:hypothetical protein